MTAALAKGLPAGIAGILGVVAAWMWFQGPILGVIAAAILAVVAWYGWDGRSRGKALLRGSSRDPVGAVPLIERWTAFALAGGALGAAVLIVLAVVLAKLTGDGTSPDDKQLITAAFGVLTTLITASLVKGLEDFGTLTSEPVETEFKAAYKGCFKPPTDEWRAIYDPNFRGHQGWASAAARRKRAESLANKSCSAVAAE